MSAFALVIPVLFNRPHVDNLAAVVYAVHGFLILVSIRVALQQHWATYIARRSCARNQVAARLYVAVHKAVLEALEALVRARLSFATRWYHIDFGEKLTALIGVSLRLDPRAKSWHVATTTVLPGWPTLIPVL